MFEFLIVCFAVWRLSRFIRMENGPKCLMSRFKAWSCRKFCRADGSDEGTLAELLSCNKCTGFWLAIGATLLWCGAGRQAFGVGAWVMMPWAISAVVIFIDYVDGILGIAHKIGRAEEKEFDRKQKEDKG